MIINSMKNSIVNLKSFLLKKSSTELSYCYNIELSCIRKNNVLKTKQTFKHLFDGILIMLFANLKPSKVQQWYSDFGNLCVSSHNGKRPTDIQTI